MTFDRLLLALTLLLPSAAMAQSQIMLDSRPHAPAESHTNQLIIGGATGGNKGIGSINAQSLYINGGPITSAFGGTGVNNGSALLTLGGNLTTTGAGATIFAFGASPFTYTFPGATTTLAAINLAQTITALQTFTNSDICILGSSTGCTTLTSANSTSSSFTLTLPAVTDTVAVLGTANQNMTGGVLTAGISIGTETSGTYTVVCGNGPMQWLTNGGAFTIAAPASDSACIIKLVNNASAGSISFSGFSVGSNTGDALDTVNGHKFFLWVGRNAGDSTYSVKALQ
jgi:hypothetical protein